MALADFRVGLYLRTSEAGAEGRLAGQEALLRQHLAKQHGFAIVGVFADAGVSGRQMQRPALRRLLAEIERGNINCIAVKDLSRFGRHYIAVGDYLENYFPQHGVRVLAVNDHYDSFDPEADLLHLYLTNLANHLYAQDIANKVRPVLRAKQLRGEFIGAWSPYGYQKSPENKHLLLPDPETAPTVQAIFSARLAGMSCGQIAKALNATDTLSPSRLRYLRGQVQQLRFAEAEWNRAGVQYILQNPVYLGHMVQGKRQASFDGQKAVPKAQWHTVEHTHSALVTPAQFAQVQALWRV